MKFRESKDFARVVLMIAVFQATPPAWAQIEGEFYPEKQSYLVGEPVFVVLDLMNPEPQPVWVSDSCAWLDTRFEAPSASKPHRAVSLFGCTGGGVGGSCGGGAKEIRPGGHFRQRYLLDGPFRLDAPGIYPIRAWHKVDIYEGATGYQIVASQDIVTEFDLSLVDGSEEELALAYAPILRDLESSDPVTSLTARSAVVQNPPRLLEDVILAMASDPRTTGDSIPGLERLATPRAKAKLAELSAAGNPFAITALGESGDSSYCSVMLDIAQESREYSRFIALRAAGYLCGERVLPLATTQLASADNSQRYEAAYALGNSHRREAVHVLISLLLDQDANVRRAAGDALATLTHRRTPDEERPPQEIYLDWAIWWASKGAGAPIYGPDECKEPEPLQ